MLRKPVEQKYLLADSNFFPSQFRGVVWTHFSLEVEVTTRDDLGCLNKNSAPFFDLIHVVHSFRRDWY